MLVASGRVSRSAEARAVGTIVAKSYSPECKAAEIVKAPRLASETLALDHVLWRGDALAYLKALPSEPVFDLIITSPPYNIGKEYETRKKFSAYLQGQRLIIDELVPRLKVGGSLCWQVGSFVQDNEVFPLDIEFAPIFRELGLKLRNRVIWHFGHGLHGTKRFSGRHETVLWYTKTPKKGDLYTFNLDAVRIDAKYPAKRHFKGPNAGELSGNPLGKNPTDVWDIPNVKSMHVEKTSHPCQFPVGLAERLILALTNEQDLVFDPFAGVASAGVAAALHKRRFIGCELSAKYANIGVKRVQEALNGTALYRPHDRPVYDHKKSSLSKPPEGFKARRTGAAE
jgi:adenine-specific DNA-methyltransferase